MRHAFWICSLLVTFVASTALAEGPEGAPPPPPPEQQPYPPQQQQPYPPQQQPPAQQYQQQPQQPQQPAPASGYEGRGIEYGAHLVVPIWLDAEHVNPGLGLQGRIGWEFPGGLTAELNIGAMVNTYTDEIVEAFGEEGFSNIWIGGGARYMFFNPSAFVPMIGAGLQLNIWNICSDDGLGGLTCDDKSALTLGFNGLVGAAYEISPFIAVEAGAQLNVTLPGEIFDQAEMYLSPFVGGTLYY